MVCHHRMTNLRSQQSRLSLLMPRKRNLRCAPGETGETARRPCEQTPPLFRSASPGLPRHFLGIHGGGVCIRKISGSVEVMSRSCPTFLQSQIFYVRIFAGYLLPNRGFQLLPCPAVLSVSALRAGALALAPTFTGLRAGRGAGLAWRPVHAPLHSRGDKAVPWPRFSFYTYAESGWNVCRGKQGNGPLRKPRSKKSAK